MSHTDTATPFPIKAPDGRTVTLPFSYDPAADPDAGTRDPAIIAARLADEGYVIARDLLPAQTCKQLAAAFRTEVKPSRAPFYRHETDHPERHVWTPDGFMKHPVLNPHELWSARFGQTKALALRLLTDLGLQHVLEGIFGEPGKLIHSMYFEGNQVTWAHQDTYYVDSTKPGSMVGAWIALEDIHPGAGRFYVYPRSHKLDLPLLGAGMDLDPNGKAYKAWVLESIARSGLECHAPALRRGDVLLFSSRTIHGSLPNPATGRSRNALTAHFIPVSHGILWFHRDVRPDRTRPVNGVTVHFNKDLDVFSNRAALHFEAWGTALRKRARALKARLQ